jgi:hypothetical protein
MRKFLTLLALTTAFSALALAETWNGVLLDESCYNTQYQQAKDTRKAADTCAATSQTTSFALLANGKVLKLDSSGNSKAMTALKNRADRTAPGQAPATHIMAKVQGTEKGGTITVDSIDVQ